MLIPEITENIINQPRLDMYNRVDTVLLLDKPAGVTSHDVVADVRKILRTRKVGHAGALDPFATGLLVVLVGKYTKYTEALINQDKSYLAEVVLGASTTTQDPEGDVEQLATTTDLEAFAKTDAEITASLVENFSPSYEQLVPLFSSVKIDGMKLRVLARKAKNIEKLAKGSYKLTLPDDETLEIDVPTREVQIPSIICLGQESLAQIANDNGNIELAAPQLKVEVDCSKGTYIRQLAEDIGEIFSLPAHLASLRRTRVGEFSLSQALNTEQLCEIAVSAKLHESVDSIKQQGLRTLV